MHSTRISEQVIHRLIFIYYCPSYRSSEDGFKTNARERSRCSSACSPFLFLRQVHHHLPPVPNDAAQSCTTQSPWTLQCLGKVPQPYQRRFSGSQRFDESDVSEWLSSVTDSPLRIAGNAMPWHAPINGSRPGRSACLTFGPTAKQC